MKKIAINTEAIPMRPSFAERRAMVIAANKRLVDRLAAEDEANKKDPEYRTYSLDEVKAELAQMAD